MGAAYYAIPRIFNCRLFSRRLANVQYFLYLFGFTFFFGGFLLTGLVQGTNWIHQGLPVWSVLPGLRPFMSMRVSGGLLVVVSFILFAINMLVTVAQRKPLEQPDVAVPASLLAS
jgi:cbb3-type cytochrome oxidase subunit 1